ncbi:MAG: PTS glucitol/sorbitol transporter subunit IIA [Anaerostipes sp.]|jgi:PTS system glucitol/sorbitol-specific IIA component|nr:PTS glucitol/sorbitol transporter subunit IIA [Anaerostipes sp.]MDD3747428.1 PTS glucitol/sorbitol transporter subunit IIA [Anaerostipes sp.]
MKYQSQIVDLGPDALAFLDDEEMNFIIIFNEDAPPELAELSVLHTKAELKETPAVGDTFKIAGKEFKISAVGDEAPHTLADLGHCTVDFKGGPEAERPGCISVEGNKLLPEDLKAGEMIEIY